jgi:hypothetical protein
MKKKKLKSNDDRKWDELIPPEGHEHVGRECFRLLEAVLADKEALGKHEAWQRAYELLNNKHWRNNTSNAKPVSVNLLWTQHRRSVNQLTDNNPTFDVKAAGIPGPKSEQVAQLTQRAVVHWWRETEQQDKFESSVSNGEAYGIAIEKSTFNPDAEYGQGEIEPVIVDPMHFGMYPVKCMDIQKAQAVLHFYPMSIRDAERQWPEAKGKIKSDLEIIQQLNDNRRDSLRDDELKSTGLIRLGGAVKQLLGYSDETTSEHDEETLILEVWVKDYTQESTQKIIGEGQIEETTYPKYTGNIRVITACSGGKVVLSDKNNPSINPDLHEDLARITYLYDKFPFLAVQSCKDTTCFWAQGDIEQLKGLNKELDKSVTQFNMSKDKSARRTLVLPKTSGVTSSQIQNGQTIIEPKTQMHGIEWLAPPGIDPEVLKAIEFYKDFFFLVGGTFDLDQAQMMSGNNAVAFKSIASLLERAATMYRGKVRAYSKLIRERGRMAVSHMQNWYTNERYIDYEEDGRSETQSVKNEHLLAPTRLTVLSGSTLPKSRIQQREEAIELFKLRAIDNEELLKAIDWENRKEVIQRMKMGPIGEFLQRISKLLPPAIVQQLVPYAKMDAKDFQKLLQSGKIKPIQMPQQGQDMLQQQAIAIELEAKEANVKKTKKEIEKVEAERQLTMAKTRKEMVDSNVAIEGVNFDVQKLRIENERLEMERADLLAKIKRLEDDENHRKVDDIIKARSSVTKSSESSKQGPYAERGLQSNNQD